MAYDHNVKAGNAGDIFKHVALIAALRNMPELAGGQAVRFVDLFSGYASNPLKPGNEWVHGVGRLRGGAEMPVTSNVDVCSYLNWYLARPTLVGGTYPGSSLIALDTLAMQGQEIALTLFDIADGPIASLRETYAEGHHTVNHHAAQSNDPDIENADFLFVDPPGVIAETEVESTLPTLTQLLSFCDQARSAMHLMWLPVTRGKAIDQDIQPLRQNGFHVTVVEWGEAYAPGTTLGCLLAYRVADQAIERIQASLDEMFRLVAWDEGSGACIKHLAPMRSGMSGA